MRTVERARSLGDHLTVGFSPDKLNFNEKSVVPPYSEVERLVVGPGLRDVDWVFLDESMDLKERYIIEHGANVLVMGHDWAGRFDNYKRICDVQCLPRTEGIFASDMISETKFKSLV